MKLRAEPFESFPHETNPSFEFEREVMIFVGNAAEVKQLGHVSFTTSGGVGGVLSRIRRIIVSLYVSETVRTAASKAVTITVIILASSYADVETMFAAFGV